MDEKLIMPFLESTKKIMIEMAGVDVETKEEFKQENKDITSYGVASIIAFSGKMKGRLLLDMEADVAKGIAETLMGESYENVKNPMLLAAISEINNIIAGDANTLINNKYGLGLRLAPPVVLAGEDIIIAIPKIKSSTAYCLTPLGKLKINVAFEGGK